MALTKIKTFVHISLLMFLFDITWVLVWDSMRPLLYLHRPSVVVGGVLKSGFYLSIFSTTAILIVLRIFTSFNGLLFSWLPKIVFIGLALVTVTSFLLGGYISIAAKDKLKSNGYLVCELETDKNHYFFEQVYVLFPKYCEATNDSVLEGWIGFYKD